MKMNNNIEIEEVLYKLSHFDPGFSDDYGCSLLDYLVLNSLYNFYNNGYVSSLEIKNNIFNVFKIDYDETEILSSYDRLFELNKICLIEPTDRNSQKNAKINEEQFKDIGSKINELKIIEQNVIDDWIKELADANRNFINIIEKKEYIIEKLKDFIIEIVIKHGIKTRNLIYQNSEEEEETIQNEIIEHFNNGNNRDELLDTILKYEILKFFKKEDNIRRDYISTLLNSSFYLQISQLDKNCAELVKQNTENQKLFLDTNILFALLGLNGSFYLTSIQNLIKYAVELKCEICITSKTISEFHYSINKNYDELKDKINFNNDLIDLAVNNLENDNLFTSYLMKHSNNGLSFEDFKNEISHLETFLKSLNIKIYNDFEKEINESEEIKDEISKLNTILQDSKKIEILEHDAFHYLFIKKMRKSNKYHYSEADFWFLTKDSKLPKYDSITKKDKKSLPFCISIEQWIQFNRPLIQRTNNTEDFKNAYYLLITQPIIIPLLKENTFQRSKELVIKNIGQYKEANPKLVFALIEDKRFIKMISDEPDEEKKIELIENKLIEVANDKENSNQELIKEVELTKDRVKQIEEKLSSKEEEHRKELNHIKINQLKGKLKTNINEKENLDKIKFPIEKKKKIFASIYLIVVIIISILYVIYFLNRDLFNNWSILEPISWLIPACYFPIYGLFWLIFHKSMDPISVFKRVINKEYNYGKFDIDYYNNLKEEISKIEEEINKFQNNN